MLAGGHEGEVEKEECLRGLGLHQVDLDHGAVDDGIVKIGVLFSVSEEEKILRIQIVESVHFSFGKWGKNGEEQVVRLRFVDQSR
jgi:hypothetical protein